MSAKPEEVLRAAAAAPAPADAEVEMVVEEHDYQFDREGRQRRTVHRVFRYLTEKGVENWSWTEADWSAGCEERPTIRARVITPDGQVHPLDPETIGEVAVEQDNPNLSSDQKLLRAPLPAIQVGAVVEEEILTRETRPLFDHGMVERLVLAESYPTRKFRLTVSYPVELPLRWEVLGSRLPPVRTEAAGRVTLRFEAGPCPARPTPEPYQPPESDRVPEIVFSTGKSWADVAAHYAELVESQLKLDAVRPLVRDTVGRETDRGKIAEMLLAAVRGHVRYTGIEFGKAAIVPRAPHDTLARRYGDCKDQSALLVAMLRVAGIPAHVAVLRTGRFSDVVPGLPGLGDFDHAIVYVPGQEPLWIDPSARCVPAGRLPLGEQDRWALVAGPQTRELVRTPRMDYRQNSSSESIEIFLSESGKARVRVTVADSGPCDADTREDYASRSVKDLRKMWRDFFKQQYRTQGLLRLEYSSPLDLSKPFRVVAEVSDARIGRFHDSEATVTIQPDPLLDQLPGLFRGEEDEDKEDKGEEGGSARASQPRGGQRQTPLVLPEPHVRQVEFRIVPPPGFVVRALPEPSVRRYGPATLSQQFQEVAGGNIVATFRLDSGPGAFTAAEVNALRRAIEELGADGGPWEVKLALEHVVGRHLAAGRMHEALSECRRLVQRHPEQAAQRQRFAQVLLRAGLGEAARDEARRAVQLDPQSPAAHAALARILTYDTLGRHFQAGMDWPSAAAEYRKALELDPADAAARMDWAILLEHNEAGLRYAPDARLEDAVAEYQQARKQLPADGVAQSLDLNLALALLHLEKYAEVEKLADRSPTSAAWKSLLAAAVAAQRGPADAQRKAAEICQGLPERRSVLEGAGEYLQEARCYAPAAALLEAAADRAHDAADLRARAKALAPLRRFGQADLARDGPRRLVQQLLLVVLLDGNSTRQLPGLLAPNTDPCDQAAVLEELRRALASLLEQQRQDQGSPQRTADVLSQVELLSEGDDKTGYRIRALNEDLQDLAWYVVVDKGGPRLLAPGPAGANLGAAALACLERGWPAGAAQWLRWAAERPVAPSTPFAPPSPFAVLWKNARQDRPDALRLAAAALLAAGNHPEPAIPILLAAERAHPAPADAVQLDRALLGALLGANRPAEALGVADRLLARSDSPGDAPGWKTAALAALGRWDDLRKFIAGQWEKAGDNPAAVELLARTAMRLGDFQTVEEHLRPLARRPKAPCQLVDCLARNAIAAGAVGPQALADALAAVHECGSENPAFLETLAVVYAELGKSSDALETLNRSLAVRGGGGPFGSRDGDWYVLGRIAEHYGLADVAAGLYRKIRRPVRPGGCPAAANLYTIAQRRLKALENP
jgi:transglutaminase-like putative cysteine protease